MKTLFHSVLLMSMISLTSFAQTSNIDAVIGALRSGNASELSTFIDNSLELTMPEQSDSYSKAQAILILKDFFNNNGVKGFEVKHKGDNGGDHFCIGTLQTRSGNFRTTVYMKMKNNKEWIKEISFQAKE